MDRLRKAAILTRLAQMLREKGSWCGETHMQKATYFLQQMLKAPFGYEFILYKHGPFSFDLRDELSALQADDLLVMEPQPIPYGPKLAATQGAQRLQERFPRTLRRIGPSLQFVVDTLGDRGGADLERLGTALYVTADLGSSASVPQRAREVSKFKSHIPVAEAAVAVREIDMLLSKAAALPDPQ
jgi:hypothetical protein